MGRKSSHLPFALFLSLSIAACGGGGGDPAPAGAPASGSTINLSGGTGTAGGGGNAGGLYVNYNNSPSNDISIRKAGTVDTAYAEPDDALAINDQAGGFYTVAADCTAAVLDNPAANEPGAGRLYVVQGDPNPGLYLATGTGAFDGSNRVYGLRIEAERTLTLPANLDQGGVGGAYDTAEIAFSGDVDIAGTLKSGSVGASESRNGVAATARDKAVLHLSGNRVRIAAAGAVITAGGNGTVSGDRGGDGGAVTIGAGDRLTLLGRIDASGGTGIGAVGGRGAVDSGDAPGAVYIPVGQTILTKGSISANGGNGTSGGYAGNIRISSERNVYNSSTISACGGTGNTDGGGNGGSVELHSSYAGVYNRGALATSGGNGPTGGGNAGSVYFYGGYNGAIGNAFNAGTITARGGRGTSAGSGAGGGNLYVETYGGEIRNSGTFSAPGGNGAGNGGNGGQGGYVYLYAYRGFNNDSGNNVPPGAVRVSGNLDLSGGAGDSGGSAGEITVESDSFSDYPYPATGQVEFVGYSTLAMGGGTGVTGGGNGGYLEAYTYDATSTAYDVYGNPIDVSIPSGTIRNEADITLSGGNASNGTGGNGGDFDLEVYGNYNSYATPEGPPPEGLSEARNLGAVDLSGGMGAGANGWGGSAGSFYLLGYLRAVNGGTLTAKGGDGTLGGGNGVAEIDIWSSYAAENRCDVNGSGGNATTDGNGGGGGYFYLYTDSYGQAVNAANVAMAGGNGKGAGSGGNGGSIDIYSYGDASLVSGTLSVAPGTGGTGGSSGGTGTIYVDHNPINAT